MRRWQENAFNPGPVTSIELYNQSKSVKPGLEPDLHYSIINQD